MLEKIRNKINIEVEKILAKETLTVDELHFLHFFSNDLESKEMKPKRDAQIMEQVTKLFSSINDK